MLWPILLPLQITLAIFASLIALVTAAAPRLNLNRGAAFGICVLIACLAFVPSCVGVMQVVDTYRFGIFTYKSFAEVRDFRVERTLPPAATNITLDKFVSGFRAKYTLSQAQLEAYLLQMNEMAATRGEKATPEQPTGTKVDAETIRLHFGHLGWPVFDDGLEYHSSTDGDDGAAYYFDPATGTVYQWAGYW